jgi:hypothetical protein
LIIYTARQKIEDGFRSSTSKKLINYYFEIGYISHLSIGAGDLREDAHYWTDEMEESHGCFCSNCCGLARGSKRVVVVLVDR